MPNTYGPEQVSALQSAFDRVWLHFADSYVMSRNDLASLIIALAADGGANDSEEIDVDDLAHEALQSVVQMRQRSVWPRRWRIPVSSPDYISA